MKSIQIIKRKVIDITGDISKLEVTKSKIEGNYIQVAINSDSKLVLRLYSGPWGDDTLIILGAQEAYIIQKFMKNHKQLLVDFNNDSEVPF